jgi:hypothetical protein
VQHQVIQLKLHQLTHQQVQEQPERKDKQFQLQNAKSSKDNTSMLIFQKIIFYQMVGM